MPSFRWSAKNPAGDVVRGVMEEPDRAIVVERLQRQGQVVRRADPADGRRGWTDLPQIELGFIWPGSGLWGSWTAFPGGGRASRLWR
jgi:hypothetical protein